MLIAVNKLERWHCPDVFVTYKYSSAVTLVTNLGHVQGSNQATPTTFEGVRLSL